ncbi:YdaU family protein [Brevundimonas sp.]|uniref:YdaU family protein n=1 Tax=Brevundimonas sp. TaxID=1871086 RepID=UPI002D3279A0|nr:DUF1376 domain-containing protein [Brevundimonas sp.]HYC66661.1 DUF1376 domain-containing protein [Brevundimonas sp.]
MSAPFMQLYVADYLGDTRHLTTEQHGAYLLLLMAMWRADGRLPNDPKKLARIVCCTPSRWAKIGGDVLEFFDVDGDDLTNARLGLELEIAQEKSIKRARSGRLGARANALKRLKGTPANDDVLLQHSSEARSQSSEDKSSGADGAVQVDHDAEAWRKAVSLLTSQGRMTEAKARPFFGRLISANKLEPRDLLPSLAKATVSGTQDPQSYLTKAAEAVARRRKEDAQLKRVGWV